MTEDRTIHGIMHAMRRVWSGIAPDVVSSMPEAYPNGIVPRDEVIEFVLDANRMETMGDLSEDEKKDYLGMSYDQRLILAQSVFQTDCLV